MPSSESLIRTARDRSNRGIAERSANIVAESLDDDFLVIVGDGTLIPSRDAYLDAFRSQFSDPSRLRYVRTPDIIEVSGSHPLGFEQGRWTATLPDGTISYSGSYSAIWRRTASGWKMRAEFFVTLTQA